MSSTCYIECFYDNVLGVNGSSQLMNFSRWGRQEDKRERKRREREREEREKEIEI